MRVGGEVTPNAFTVKTRLFILEKNEKERTFLTAAASHITASCPCGVRARGFPSRRPIPE